jgi:hypothetical protein
MKGLLLLLSLVALTSCSLSPLKRGKNVEVTLRDNSIPVRGVVEEITQIGVLLRDGGEGQYSVEAKAVFIPWTSIAKVVFKPRQ